MRYLINWFGTNLYCYYRISSGDVAVLEIEVLTFYHGHIYCTYQSYNIDTEEYIPEFASKVFSPQIAEGLGYTSNPHTVYFDRPDLSGLTVHEDRFYFISDEDNVPYGV